MGKKLVYDYYDVDIPSDCSNEPKERFDLAVLEARENIARLYVIPCEWRFVSDDGNTVKICRVRYATKES